MYNYISMTACHPKWCWISLMSEQRWRQQFTVDYFNNNCKISGHWILNIYKNVSGWQRYNLIQLFDSLCEFLNIKPLFPYIPLWHYSWLNSNLSFFTSIIRFHEWRVSRSSSHIETSQASCILSLTKRHLAWSLNGYCLACMWYTYVNISV